MSKPAEYQLEGNQEASVVLIIGKFQNQSPMYTFAESIHSGLAQVIQLCITAHSNTTHPSCCETALCQFVVQKIYIRIDLQYLLSILRKSSKFFIYKSIKGAALWRLL
jgi:hypothetical protein